MTDSPYRKKNIHEEMHDQAQRNLNDMNPFYRDPETAKLHKEMDREGQKVLEKFLNPFEFFK